ncbi:MAG: hypothetical protein PSY14_00955 [bacterium]|nr:hypothetical protein [bacterium]
MRNLSVLFFIAALLYSSVSFSSDDQYLEFIRQEEKEKLEKTPAPTLFSEKDLQDAPTLCKYAGSRKATGTTSASPEPFFKGVKGIYLASSSYSSVRDLNIAFFEPEKISQIAACVLDRHFDTLANYDTNSISPIPIYIPQRDGIPLDLWPEAAGKGNVIIWIELGMREGKNWFDDANSNLLMLKVIYARNDVTPIEQIGTHCSSPFPYTADKDKLLKFLSSAMRTCLAHKYQIPPKGQK